MFEKSHRFSVEGGSVARCAPDWEWRHPGGRDVFNLWLIHSGEGLLTSDGTDYRLGAGECFLLRLWKPQHGRHNPQKPLTVPFVLFKWFDESGGPPGGQESLFPPLRFQVKNLSLMRDIIERCIECRERGEQEEAVHWLKTALLELRRSTRSDYTGLELEQFQAVSRICRRVTENPSRKYSVRKLATECHYTADHFIRLFKKFQGVTPCDFIIQSRMRQAETLLLFSGHSLARIAEILGYKDEFCFSAQFKKRRGLSPARFRDLHSSPR
jgi:AraC-like DNA-binding protein